MSGKLKVLGPEGLRRYIGMQADAVNAVTARFYATTDPVAETADQKGRDACREDLAFHLEFLRPVLEFGLLQPMVDYLRWLGSVLSARNIPVGHLAQSLDWLAEYYAENLDAGDGSVVAESLRAAREEFLKPELARLPSRTAREAWAEAADFEAALLAGSQREALQVVYGCLDRGRGLVETELHVIEPALCRIGEKWQANQVTVAQEHMATAIVQAVMTVAMLRTALPSPINRKVLLACVEGNNHAVGLRMVADAFQLAGWDVQYLGANVPTAALVRQAKEWNADLVGLSVSFAQQLRMVRVVIRQLGEAMGDRRPAVIVGGQAINRCNQLVDVLGADGAGVDAQAAVDSAGSILCDRARQ